MQASCHPTHGRLSTASRVDMEDLNQGAYNAAQGQPKAGEGAEATPVPNPLASGLNLTISVPDDIEIKVVDASALDEYEVWVLLASLVMNAVVGFGVAFFQDTKQGHLGWVALMFVLIFLICGGSAVHMSFSLVKAVRSLRSVPQAA